MASSSSGVEVPAGVAADLGQCRRIGQRDGVPCAIASTAGMPKLSQSEGKTRAVASA